MMDTDDGPVLDLPLREGWTALGVSQMWLLLQRTAANDRFTAQLDSVGNWMAR